MKRWLGFIRSIVVFASLLVGSDALAAPAIAPPPALRILSPADGSVVRAAEVRVRVAVRTADNVPIRRVYALIGQEVVAQTFRATTRDLSVSPAIPTEPEVSDSAEQIFELVVPVPAEDISLAVRADLGANPSLPVVIHLRWEGTAQQAFTVKPKLYMLAVGVSKYRQKGLTLTYPAKDAADLVDAFTRQSGRLYGEIQSRVFVDADATKGNILDGLEWLQRQTTARDVAVLFLAGHGINNPSSGRYFFVPHDGDTSAIQRTMISQDDLQGVLKTIAGKVLVFMDTCHSGNAIDSWVNRRGSDATPFIQELSSAENGIVVFAATTGRQASKESPEWSNGAFTRALLEALHGGAAFVVGRPITVNMLDVYLSERVKELTAGTQATSTAKPSTMPDFPVAIAGDTRDKDAHARLLGADSKPHKAFYKQWWFWTGVGAAAAVATVGVVAGTWPRTPSDAPQFSLVF